MFHQIHLSCNQLSHFPQIPSSGIHQLDSCIQFHLDHIHHKKLCSGLLKRSEMFRQKCDSVVNVSVFVGCFLPFSVACIHWTTFIRRGSQHLFKKAEWFPTTCTTSTFIKKFATRPPNWFGGCYQLLWPRNEKNREYQFRFVAHLKRQTTAAKPLLPQPNYSYLRQILTK